jgi:hypothetical protein
MSRLVTMTVERARSIHHPKRVTSLPFSSPCQILHLLSLGERAHCFLAHLWRTDLPGVYPWMWPMRAGWHLLFPRGLTHFSSTSHHIPIFQKGTLRLREQLQREGQEWRRCVLYTEAAALEERKEETSSHTGPLAPVTKSFHSPPGSCLLLPVSSGGGQR